SPEFRLRKAWRARVGEQDCPAGSTLHDRLLEEPVTFGGREMAAGGDGSSRFSEQRDVSGITPKRLGVPLYPPECCLLVLQTVGTGMLHVRERHSTEHPQPKVDSYNGNIAF